MDDMAASFTFLGAVILITALLLTGCAIDFNGTHYRADPNAAPVVCKHQSPGVIKCRSE